MNDFTGQLPADLAALHARLGRDFGRLDNTPAKWIGQRAALQAAFPAIEAVLEAHLGASSWSLATFREAIARFTRLADEVEASDVDPPEIELSLASLTLRFYIWQASLLDALSETLVKRSIDPASDADQRIRRSALAPYFFKRAHLDREEALDLIEFHLAELAELAPGPRVVLQAARIRSGIHNALGEEYAPNHPLIYPDLHKLMDLKFAKDGSGLDELRTLLGRLRDQIAAAD